MPSTKSSTQQKTAKVLSRHILFFPLLTLVLILWLLYRSLFNFPVWFDETIGKAVFFGLPVWVYVTITGYDKIIETFSSYKLREGLLMGIAIGGIYGFVMSIVSLVQSGATVQAVMLFDSAAFWREFSLALLTSFWETLLFFSFVMVVLMEKYKQWSMLKTVLFTAAIFLVFHVPNTFLRFDGAQVVSQIFILALFAVGQALLFYDRKNAFALILSQAIWGMVLLVHAW
ncbi:MAG: hypothetical protein GW762_00570 [Candidatus Pacebacteria bacterium]|nr:hypothetical protein [Candidatus Paceibacterota bacterium]PIR63689.1 MAG: hypothetical protein COU64_03065 [Candidatus Pacebacteria bacterium CG10_big_fil_rev_8_21_14_0_10_40_26]PIZ79692.1 MAG: hypothetical protein COY01_00105 [Candidatus Pacebacteria bacterium CG_4_10_14_0_2_um_filter_40_20]PJA68336.1 MAG: hypothetical protein CO156_05060 [Candidatus Pacebacteria bacterium CG_4_9_14_3_um_filter_40_12]PJC41198.1 MAG: hypothetical protein CO041_05130 [Candidatus Pacebacteria bacterium CG_4_9_